MEIYTSDSSDGEAVGEGAYSGYEAQVLEGHMPLDLGEYLSDESTDTSYTTSNYRTHRAPPTPPRPHEGEGTFRVIVDDCEDEDTTYFSYSESDNEWEDTKNTDKCEKDIGYKSDDIYISDSDDKTLMSDHDTIVGTNVDIGDTSEK